MDTWLKHPHEGVLEEYKFGRLAETASASLEEHLLACESCQSRLQEIDEFVLALKQAPPEFIALAAPHRQTWWARLRESLREWLVVSPGRATLAGALALLCLVAIALRPRPADQPGVPVTLVALRGGGPAHAATAPAGRPLDLSLEVPDIAASTPCRVEIVTSSGSPVWTGRTPAGDGRLRIEARVSLRAGAYWVRLYTAGPDPVREFGLRLE